VSTCLQEEEVSAFSTEHVVPRGLGNWRNALTLPKGAAIVCGACNQFFGDTLDLTFNRDSHEASLRLRHGAKKASEVGEPFRHVSPSGCPRTTRSGR